VIFGNTIFATSPVGVRQKYSCQHTAFGNAASVVSPAVSFYLLHERRDVSPSRPGVLGATIDRRAALLPANISSRGSLSIRHRHPRSAPTTVAARSMRSERLRSRSSAWRFTPVGNQIIHPLQIGPTNLRSACSVSLNDNESLVGRMHLMVRRYLGHRLLPADCLRRRHPLNAA
jgi:hypothetical protein